MDRLVSTCLDPQSRMTQQVLLRHALERGAAVIPKSANATRLAENAGALAFSLAAEDRALLDSLPTLLGRRADCDVLRAGRLEL